MIAANNLTVTYKMAAGGATSIKEYIVSIASGKLQYNYFSALQDVSFTINKNEVIGIIGKNGAGKSTLLKVIAGILKPTSGDIKVNGNIVPMLELGSGFDMELTGRENIFLNGAILGYSKEFLESKFDEIVRFSELDNFINSAIRTYSSGMLMRLAFSIASVVEPEILIVDEILAVGDADFQAKSKKRMLQLMSGGTTVLFVSHDIAQIRAMCNRVIWLEHGKLREIGDTKTICDQYVGTKKEAQANEISKSKTLGEVLVKKKDKNTNELKAELFERYLALECIRPDYEAAYAAMKKCCENGGKLLIAGNGGSAADSEHIVGELMKSFLFNRKIDNHLESELYTMYGDSGKALASKLEGALPAIPLASMIALSTAFANDSDPTVSFAQIVNGLGSKEDIFFGISTSGNSQNILNAFMVAKAKKLTCIALTGQNGGKCADLADITIRVPSDETFKIQEYHLPVYHTLCAMLEADMFEERESM